MGRLKEDGQDTTVMINIADKGKIKKWALDNSIVLSDYVRRIVEAELKTRKIL